MEEVVIAVKIKLKHDVDMHYLRAYVKDAVIFWCGQYHPDDELRTGIKSVTTRLLK